MAKENYLLPFTELTDKRTGLLTPLVGIWTDPTTIFDNNTIKTIKSYLNRGIAVAGWMSVATSLLNLSEYDGSSYIMRQCQNLSYDHQIVFNGYKTIDGVECWSIRNSWGSDWGYYGHFYVPIGNNYFCIEQYAYAVIPLGYNG